MNDFDKEENRERKKWKMTVQIHSGNIWFDAYMAFSNEKKTITFGIVQKDDDYDKNKILSLEIIYQYYWKNT